MRSRKSIDSKLVKIEPSKCKLSYFEPTCLPFGLPRLLPISKYTKCVYQANLVYSMLSWIKPHLNELWNHYYQSISKGVKNQSPILYHVTIKVFPISVSFVLLWFFNFSYFTMCLITSIDLVLKLYWIT